MRAQALICTDEDFSTDPVMSQASASASYSQHGPRSGPPLPPAPLLGFVVAFAAVFFIALLTWRALQTRTAATNRVTTTLALMERLQSVLSLTKDAETGQRGYLLTGEESYLEPFTNAKAALPAQLKETRELLQDRPEQLPRVGSLEQTVTEKLAELQQTVNLKRAGETGGALAIVRTDRGKLLMDRIRAIVSQ